MSTRTTGRIVALLLAAAVIGIIIFGLSRAARTPAPAGAVAPIAGELAPGIEPSETSRAAGVQDLVALGRQGVWTHTDPETGRLQYRLTWQTLDPDEGGVIRLGRPEAWIHLDESSVIRLRAPAARLLWPAREREPESGSLTGGVIAELHGVAPGGTEPAGPARLTLRTETIGFQSQLGELTAPEPMTIEGPGLFFAGRGLTLTASDVDRRLRTLRLDRGEVFRYRASEAEAFGPSAGREGRPAPSQPSSSAGRIEDAYRITFSNSVVAVAGTRTIRADELGAFVRLVDGRLRPGAIADMRRRASTTGEAAAPSTPAPEPAATQADIPDEITLTWSGPLEIRRLREAAPELARDDLFVSLGGGAGQPATFTDTESPSTVAAAVMQVGLTTMSGALIGDARAPARAAIGAEFEAASPRIEFDLVQGLGALVGGGMLRSIESAGARERRLEWAGRGDIRFDTSSGPVGAGGVVVPIEAVFGERIAASDATGSAKGDSLRVLFRRFERGAGDGSRSRPIGLLTRLVIGGAAEVRSADGELARADAIDIAFAPDPDSGRSVPALAAARGNAVAQRLDTGESLAGEILEIAFERDGSARARPAGVRALGGVTITARDGVAIHAENLRGDQRTRVYDLTGSPVTISQSREDDASSIRGESARFDAAARMLTIFGGGAGSFVRPALVDRPAERIDVTWTGSLSYDDAAGHAECIGDATVIAARGEVERHTGRGERITIDLAPAPTSPAGDDAARSAGAARRLARAEIQGGSYAGRADTPAEVELRQYSAAQPSSDSGSSKALQALAYLSSPRIILLGQAERLEAPGPGKLLIEDRRASEARAAEVPSQPNSQPVTPEFRDTRGTTLFEWTDSLTWSRTEGVATIAGRASMRHVPAAGAGGAGDGGARGGERITLEADTLAATLRAGSSPESPAMNNARLERATAAGNVRASWKTGQIAAGMLDYDDAAGKITAGAEEPSYVTALDTATGRITEAQSLEYDLRTGKIRVIRLRASGGR